MTKTLLVAGDGVASTLPSGARGATLHAYDKDNGNILWERQLASAPEGIPAVYEANGREYVVFCTRDGEALDNLPANPNQVVQAVGSTEHQGYYVFALPKVDQPKPAMKK